MTPRQKALQRAEEINDALISDALPAGKRKALEQELCTIADNIAEGCYSNDPDDGIDWSDCPGIHYSQPHRLHNETEVLKFYCPPMTYKLYYENDEGRVTYDDYIPSDIIEPYRDKIAKALEQAYFFKIEHSNVKEVTPGVELVDGKLYAVLTVSLDAEPPPENIEELRKELTERTAKWSMHFEQQQIKTDGGNLYVCFYDGSDPMLTEPVFKNLAYVKKHNYVFANVRFYKDGDGLRMIYYNPDSSAGGQLVQNNLSLDMLRDASEESVIKEQFWERLDEGARQFLTDIDSPDFSDEARFFVEEPCDFCGQGRLTMEAIQDWVASQWSDIGQANGMKMQ